MGSAEAKLTSKVRKILLGGDLRVGDHDENRKEFERSFEKRSKKKSKGKERGEGA